jgi:Leucine-rich repeat (LRR) protein
MAATQIKLFLQKKNITILFSSQNQASSLLIIIDHPKSLQILALLGVLKIPQL